MVHEILTPDNVFDLDLSRRSFEALERGEQLTLWSVRAIVFGHADCPALRRALQVALGSSAEEAFAALFVAVRLLGWCARRRLSVHAPGCDGVAEDERGLLDLFAAAHEALIEGDETAVRARLDDFVRPGSSEGLLMTLQTVASALELSGYPLRSPRAQACSSASRRLH